MGSSVGLAPASDPVVTKLNTLISGYGIYNIKLFNTESDLESYVRDQSYSTNSQICFAITVQGSSSNSYQYKLRFNVSTNPTTTDGPNPSIKLTEDKGIDLDMYLRTFKQGMIGANVLVGTAILQLQTGSSSDYLQTTVSPMYQEDYTLDNIYTNMGNTIGIITLLPLLIIYLRQTSSMLTEK